MIRVRGLDIPISVERSDLIAPSPGCPAKSFSDAGGGLGRGSELGVISLKININFAGGSPAAAYYSCFAKKSKQKKAIPGLPPLRGTLNLLKASGAAELALRAQTVLA